MASNPQIKAVITAEDRASATLNKFGQNVNGVSSKISKGLKVAAVGVAAAATAAVAFGVSSVKSFQESENAVAQLNAVLKSTKGVAGVTAKAATNLANSLQKVTKYSDEDVMSAESLLLTFTKIGKDIFPQATKTVLDMSTALGQDTKASAIQLGKALQDPILGVTALRRVGVNFSKDQQEVIKKLVETGKSAEAQRLIMKELNTEFGGSAEAAGKTFSGRLAILKNQFDELKEKIGGFIANGLLKLYDTLNQFNASGGGNQILTSLKNIGQTLWNVVTFLNIYWKAAWDVVKSNAGAIKKSFDEVWTTIQTQLVPALKQLWVQVGPQLGPALKTLGLIVGVTIVAAIIAFAKTLNFAIIVLSKFINAQNTLYRILGAILSPIVRFQVYITSFIVNPLIKAQMWIYSVINAMLGFGKKIVNAVSGIGNRILGQFSGPLSWVIDALNTILGLIGKISSAKISSVGKTVVGAAKSAAKASGTDFFSPRRYATGTGNAAGGMALVGERGPEMVSLPRGSKVARNDETNRMMGGSTTINISVPMMTGSATERRKVARMLIKDIQDLASMNGKGVTDMLSSNYGLIS